MNKKIITLLLIIGMLTAGFGLVSANETLSDNSDSTVSQENTENDASQTPEVDAQVDDVFIGTEITNESNESANVNDTNDTEEFIEEEYDLNQMKELISTMNDTELNALAHYLKVNNVNGEYDDIIAIISSENYDINELMDALDELDDEEFLTFVDIVEMILDDPSLLTYDTVKNTQTTKNPVNTILEKTGTSNAIGNIVSVFYPKQNSYNDIIVHGPGIEDIIYDSLDAYFKGKITLDELLKELEHYMDPSLVTENEDGSLTIDGKVITSAQDFLDAFNEDKDATNTTANETDVNQTNNDTASDAQDEHVIDSVSDDTTSDDSVSDDKNTNSSS